MSHIFTVDEWTIDFVPLHNAHAVEPSVIYTDGILGFFLTCGPDYSAPWFIKYITINACLLKCFTLNKLHLFIPILLEHSCTCRDLLLQRDKCFAKVLA